MYQIYIRHFYPPAGRSGGIIEAEELMYEIPAEYPEDEGLIDPKVKNEMGKAGSFEFAMEQTNPWYGSLCQMTTIMRVKYDDETIFYGRVLAIDTDMWGKRTVHCEGALAFLIDTLMEATKEQERKKISINTYIKDLIDSHNNLMGDEPNKKFNCGQIPGYYSLGIPEEMKPEAAEDRTFGVSSWTSILNALEDLTSKYGGYMRARYDDSDNNLYLDWFRNYYDPDIVNQTLEVSENIIDISGTVDVNGVFTVLIPEGTANGKPIYLDYREKVVTKVPIQPTPKPDEDHFGPTSLASGGIVVVN